MTARAARAIRAGIVTALADLGIRQGWERSYPLGRLARRAYDRTKETR